MVAGAINILIGGILWLLAKHSDREPVIDAPPAAVGPDRPIVKLVLLSSAFTGLASFIYEIIWVRLLNLTLGSTIHTFELMLSAFVGGIALGGYWIRRRIDQLDTPLLQGGMVQIAMGILAASSLVWFDHLPQLVAWMFNATSRSGSGYSLYLVFSSLIAIAIMLPTTLMAGMTLPLFTTALTKHGAGERAVGAVYAANTVGAIAGVLFAVHVGLPILGAKNVLLLGSAVDIAIGLYLIHLVDRLRRRSIAVLSAALIPSVLLAIALLVRMDPLDISVGAFRRGDPQRNPNATLEFYRDGKTATVSVVKMPSGIQSIATNGKVDAGLQIDIEKPPASDELTMIGAAALPLAMQPNTHSAAVIGFGSGLTANTLLDSPHLEKLDVIEIETAMIEGARTFQHRVAGVFSDPRVQIHVDDARSFFSGQSENYDLIVSEPSNPWVNGVSSLFTQEFYTLVRKHLNRHGLLVQWIQVYEFNKELMASVLLALDRTMSDYAIYLMVSGDLLVVASPSQPLALAGNEAFTWPKLRHTLERLDINSSADLNTRLLLTRKSAHPLLTQTSVSVNSDFFPILELQAPLARFKAEWADEFEYFNSPHIPLHELFDDKLHRALVQQTSAMATTKWSTRAREYRTTKDILQWLDNARNSPSVMAIATLAFRCPKALEEVKWQDVTAQAAMLTIPLLDASQAARLWNPNNWSRCTTLNEGQRQILAAYFLAANRDGEGTFHAVQQLLEQFPKSEIADYWVDLGMWGALLSSHPYWALQLEQQYANMQAPSSDRRFVRTLLIATAKSRIRPK